MELPGNTSKDQEHIVRKIVTTPVNEKKPSFFQTFIAKDLMDIKDYVIYDLVIPKIKETVLEGLNMMFWGDSRPRSSGSSGGVRIYRSNGTTDYASIGSSNKPVQPIRSRRSDVLENVVIGNSDEAVQVLDELVWHLDRYGKVKLSVYYQMVGITPSTTDEKWGWTNLDGVKVIPTSGGYYLNLPRPESLNG